MASAKLPTPDELKAVGRQLGLTLSDADVAFFLETMAGSVAAYHAIEAMADPIDTLDCRQSSDEKMIPEKRKGSDKNTRLAAF